MLITKEKKEKILDKLLEQSMPILILLVGVFFIVQFAVAEIDKKDKCNELFIQYLQEQRIEERAARLEQHAREKEYIKVIERSNLLHEQIMKKL